MSDSNDSGKTALRFAQLQAQTRRHFLLGGAAGLGAMFLGSSRATDGASRLSFSRDANNPLASLPPQFTPKARRVIYLHMAGAPSQLELFDYKPQLIKYDGQDCPASFLVGKRFAFISGVPKLMGARYPFHQAGKSGAWISDRFPHLEKHVDESRSTKWHSGCSSRRPRPWTFVASRPLSERVMAPMPMKAALRTTAWWRAV